VPRTYVVRKVEESDRAKGEGWARAEEERQEREELACPICQRQSLTPTARGTSRTHTRWDVPQPSWDRVRQIRKDIQELQAELDRELDRLEDESDADEVT